MKIVVLEGSPNKNGSSNMLAKEFIRGAQEAHYETLLRYLNLTDMGRVWGRGCGTPSMTKHFGYMKQAYEMGKNLR